MNWKGLLLVGAATAAAGVLSPPMFMVAANAGLVP